jgi:hypothetical protein
MMEIIERISGPKSERLYPFVLYKWIIVIGVTHLLSSTCLATYTTNAMLQSMPMEWISSGRRAGQRDRFTLSGK